jgi:hypothetical protein
MKVIELVTELWKQPMMAEIIWLDERLGYGVAVASCETMQGDGLPPVCYLGPDEALGNTMLCAHGLKPGECSACELAKDCEEEI